MNLKVASMNSSICVWRFDVQPVVWNTVWMSNWRYAMRRFLCCFFARNIPPNEATRIHYHNGGLAYFPQNHCGFEQMGCESRVLFLAVYENGGQIFEKFTLRMCTSIYIYIYKHTPAVDLSIADYRYVKCCVCLSSTPLSCAQSQTSVSPFLFWPPSK